MLALRDIHHLPLLDRALERIWETRCGLILVTGWTPTTTKIPELTHSLLPSGRVMIFWVLVNEFLAAHPESRAVIVTRDRASARFSGRLKSQVAVSLVTQSHPYPVLIEAAARRRPELLVIDELRAENALPAFEAARRGQTVITQMNSLLSGAEVIRQLQAFQLDGTFLQGLDWIFSVERHPGLCPRCRQADPLAGATLSRLQQRFPHLKIAGDEALTTVFYKAAGCPHCKGSGHSGEISVFDLCQTSPEYLEDPSLPSQYSRQDYLLELARQGHVQLQDILSLDLEHRHRLFAMLESRDASIEESNSQLRRRLVELEAANLVLQLRTEQLISLESISQMLIAVDDLPTLAQRVCQRMESLCGADYAILYHYRQGEMGSGEARSLMEVLAVQGWDRSLQGRQLPSQAFQNDLRNPDPHPVNGMPPGIMPVDLVKMATTAKALKAGLILSLMAHDQPVGMMVVQSTRKNAFTPGEAALLKAFANQVAVAVQRAGLLNTRIENEKLERELELARRLQQSLLPKIFPAVPGLHFAAHNQPARWVGGDFYDVFPLGEGRYGIVIGDASDKGIPAALYMALTRSLILAEARRSFSTERVLRNVNQILLDLGELHGFITVFFGILDVDHLRLVYTRAGHDEPYLYRAGRLQRLPGDGMLLGMLADADLVLNEHELTLLPGDHLVFYTDGVKDVVDPGGRLLDQAAFEKMLAQSLSATDEKTVCRNFFERLQVFQAGADQFDDMTMLTIFVDKT